MFHPGRCYVLLVVREGNASCRVEGSWGVSQFLGKHGIRG
jgi:hypothetical protein